MSYPPVIFTATAPHPWRGQGFCFTPPGLRGLKVRWTIISCPSASILQYAIFSIIICGELNFKNAPGKRISADNSFQKKINVLLKILHKLFEFIFKDIRKAYHVIALHDIKRLIQHCLKFTVFLIK